MENYMHRKVKTKAERIIGLIFKGFLGLVAVIAFAFLFGYGVMLLWNWLIPDIFGASTINFWQAVGILVLTKVLFGGFGGHNSKRSRHNSRNHWKRKMSQNCKNNSKSWKYYDKFWEEEGKNAFKEYVKRNQEDNPQPLS